MAPGQYDVPHRRPPPKIGPPRPPVSPSTLAGSLIASPSSPTAFHVQAPSTERRESFIAVLTLAGKDMDSDLLRTLVTNFQMEAAVEEFCTVDGILHALSRNPLAVMIPNNSINESDFGAIRSSLDRYVRNGGQIIRDAAQLAAILRSRPAPRRIDPRDKRHRKHDSVTAISEVESSFD